MALSRIRRTARERKARQPRKEARVGGSPSWGRRIQVGRSWTAPIPRYPVDKTRPTTHVSMGYIFLWLQPQRQTPNLPSRHHNPVKFETIRYRFQ